MDLNGFISKTLILPAKQYSQCSQFPPKLGWIGCAIQQANSKRLPGFFFFLDMKPLRMPAHFSSTLFCLQLECTISPACKKLYILEKNTNRELLTWLIAMAQLRLQANSSIMAKVEMGKYISLQIHNIFSPFDIDFFSHFGYPLAMLIP